MSKRSLFALSLVLGVHLSGWSATINPVTAQEPPAPVAVPEAAAPSVSQPQAPVTATPETSQPEAAKTAAPKPAKRAKISLSADKEALKITDDIETAKKQAEANPNDPEAHFLLAAAYSRSPYLEQAFQEIKKTKNLLKANKDFEFIDRTIPQYERLAKTNPDNATVLYRLAMAQYLKAYSLEKYPHHYKNTPTGTPQEFYTKAENTMRKVVEMDPKDTWARNYLGYLITENGKDLAKGIPVWEESLAIDSEKNPGAYLMLSQAYFKQGNLPLAAQYAAKGLAIKQAMGMTLP